MTLNAPSLWIARYLSLASPGQTALDVAAGSGRHLRHARTLGYRVTAIDRDLSKLSDLASAPSVSLIEADLEDGSPWPLPGATFNAVIVTNYLYRPLFPALVAAVARDGVLLYETFATGNERYGKPSNANFLLRPSELLDAVRGHLTPVAFQHTTLDNPVRIVQRIAAVGPAHPWLDHPPP
jgi:SAM-dependent methyltransferase